jgi:hypothetical protein
VFEPQLNVGTPIRRWHVGHRVIGWANGWRISSGLTGTVAIRFGR